MKSSTASRFASYITLLIVITSAEAFASNFGDARSVAMSGSHLTLAQGHAAVGVNPANLGLDDRPSWSLGLFGIGSVVHNNAFSLNDYKTYNGAHLSTQDKYDILDKIPDEGLEFKGNSAASVLGLSFGPFAFSTSLEAGGHGIISKDLVDLALFGNRVGETVSVTDADADAVAHVDFNLSYGRTLRSFQWGDLSAGVNLKYIYGVAFVEATEVEAQATTLTTGIRGDGSAIIRTAEGGSGFGLDLGTSAQFRDRWRFAAAIENLVSNINWSKNTEETEYVFEAQSMTAETVDDDSLVVSDEIEREIGSFSTSLAPKLTLGAAYLLPKITIETDLKFGLRDKFGVTTTPELSTGAEYSGLGFMPLRAGIAFGGFDGTSVSLGAGLKMSSFHIDFAWASTGTLMPGGGKGISLAVSSGLEF